MHIKEIKSYLYFDALQMQEREQNKKDKEVEGSGKTVTVEENKHVRTQLSIALRFIAVHSLNDFFSG